MRYLKRKFITMKNTLQGVISDTWNIENKSANAPSMRLVEEQLIPDGLIENNIYSFEETKIGIWINPDGSKQPVYRKVVDFGALPDNAQKTVPHGINNLKTFTHIYARTKRPSDNMYFPLPYASFSISTDTSSSALYYILKGQVLFRIEGDNILIASDNGRSAFSETYVILEYTKTTD